jgi:hypothetical protein
LWLLPRLMYSLFVTTAHVSSLFHYSTASPPEWQQFCSLNWRLAGGGSF